MIESMNLKYEIKEVDGSAAFVTEVGHLWTHQLRAALQDLEQLAADVEAHNWKECPTCHGKGSGMMNVQERDQGSGWVTEVRRQVQCLRCSGTGKIRL